MAIPDYQSTMLPVLQFMNDSKEHSLREVTEHIVGKFKLTDSEQRELLASGQQPIIDNRVGWARTYLKKAGLLESTRRGYLKITEKGLGVLKENVQRIDVKFLKRFPEFVEFQTTKKDKAVSPDESDATLQQTPEESLEDGYQKIRENLSQELARSVKACSPKFFERLVVELLLSMGYGGTLKDAGKAIGQSGDGGIDGIIKEDKLGLDAIYIQAKRWDGTTVGRPEIQKFVGALDEQRAKKGVFITTSSFSKDARDYASKITTKVVLIDGEELTQLMIDNNIGVSTSRTYDIKKMDSDYFTEE